MTQIRNVSGVARVVPELNFRKVDPDEVVEVPADRLAGYTCQVRIWRDETPTKTTKGDTE